MLAKAVVVTDDSTLYLRREFTDGRELVMFRRQGSFGTLPERVFDLFGHLERHRRLQIVDMLRRETVIRGKAVRSI